MAQTRDAAALLSSLPSVARSDFVLLDGTLDNEPDIDGWQLVLNDYVVFTLHAQHTQSESHLRFLVALRPGDNSVRLESLPSPDKQFRPPVARRWTKHIFRPPDRNPDQFVVLVSGQRKLEGDSDIQEFRKALMHRGIPSNNFRNANSLSQLDASLSDLRAKMTDADRLLIYFNGEATLAPFRNEPLLHLARGDAPGDVRVSISDLVRESGDVSSLSLILDLTFLNDELQLKDQAQYTEKWSFESSLGDRSALPWLQTLAAQSNFEIALSNPLNPHPAPGELTQALIAGLEAVKPSPACETLGDAIRGTSSWTFPTLGTERPIYFATNKAALGCFTQPGLSPTSLSIAISRLDLGDPWMIAAEISTQVPTNVQPTWSELLIDGVLVQHTFTGNLSAWPDRRIAQGASLSEGTHLVELRVGDGAKVLLSGTTHFTIPEQPVTAVSSSDRLQTSILRPTQRGISTSNAVTTIAFTARDEEEKSVHYEIRNNGVVIRRGMASRLKEGQPLEIVRSIPLSLGVNNIVVEVSHPGYVKSAATSVTRRLAQPIHAVLIGVDEPNGLSPLAGVPPDVALMRKLLLEFSDATPKDIVVLTGREATREAIVRTIGSSSISHPADPFLQGAGEETLFLYFSGYGTTIGSDANQELMRCIIPADFDPSSPRETCLSTESIDELLDSWNRSIVLFDTSYDGLAGPLHPNSSKTQTSVSRTLKDFFSEDPGWRLTSGTDRPERVFLVASGTNSPALETGSPPNGLFTRSFVEAVREQLSPQEDAVVPALSLFDAFGIARTKTIRTSNKEQTPVIKGFLSTPYTFTRKSLSDLKREARAIDQTVRDDIHSLRPIDDNQIQRGLALYRTLKDLQPEDLEARQGEARMSLYRGDLARAEELIEAGILESGPPLEGNTALANWLVLRSELKRDRGDLSGALTDCEQSASIIQSRPMTKATLGALYLAAGRYPESATLFQKLLVEYTRSVSEQDLTDDEWGQIVLLTYLSLKRAGHHLEATEMLKNYSNSYANKRPSGSALGAMFQIIFPFLKRAASPLSSVQAPWSHVVADYLLNPEAYGDRLRSFREETLFFDRKDKQSFQCVLHFYVGMRAVLNNSPDDARKELQASIDTGQKQLIEYWIAKTESDALQRRAANSKPKGY